MPIDHQVPGQEAEQRKQLDKETLGTETLGESNLHHSNDPTHRQDVHLDAEVERAYVSGARGTLRQRLARATVTEELRRQLQ